MLVREHDRIVERDQVVEHDDVTQLRQVLALRQHTLEVLGALDEADGSAGVGEDVADLRRARWSGTRER